MTEVIMTQHPVGQGGMMSGFLKEYGKQLSWVYDCGSNQTDALNQEINNIKSSTIDYLFLSHLDSDHISGIARLLQRTKVKEVVLPYLNEVDRFIALAHDVAAETITEEFQAFLPNIENWFHERGVESITYILPNNDDDQTGSEGPNIPLEPRNNENSLSAHWSSSGELISQQTTNSCRVTIQNPTSFLHAITGLGDYWIFSPYAHRPSDKLLKLFVNDLKKKFNVRKITNALLISILKDVDKKKLEALRDCYDNIWTDHNLVSMALYTGPTKNIGAFGKTNQNRVYFDSTLEEWIFNNSPFAGWLSTGDMHLERINRRKAFFSHYGKLLDLVNVFVLPHHGSKQNFHSTLIDKVPNSRHCIAAAGPNGYGHPSAAVMRAVLYRDKGFIKVSDKPHTLLQWRHSI